MPPIDIDSQGAHDAAATELAKPIYPKSSLTERISEWVNELIHRLMAGAAELPGGWLALVVLGVLAAAAAIVAIRVARRTLGRGGDDGLYGSSARSSAEYRSEAERAAGRGDWAGAIRHRLRAIARSLEEDGVLSAVPGRTAGEFAREAGTALPGLSDDFGRAAGIFNDVTYGEQPGSEPDYRFVASVDERLRSTAATPSAGTR